MRKYVVVFNNERILVGAKNPDKAKEAAVIKLGIRPSQEQRVVVKPANERPASIFSKTSEKNKLPPDTDTVRKVLRRRKYLKS